MARKYPYHGLEVDDIAILLKNIKNCKYCGAELFKYNPLEIKLKICMACIYKEKEEK